MKASYFSKDVQEFIKCLAEFNVRYVIVGGEAVIYYGFARLTGDIDFFYEPQPKNVKNLYAALNKFWNGEIPGIESKKDFMEVGTIIQFGVPPNRIDLINSITDVTFDEAWRKRVSEKIGIEGRIYSVYFIGLNELIKNKKAIKRYKDLEDIKYLGKVRKGISTIL